MEITNVVEGIAKLKLEIRFQQTMAEFKEQLKGEEGDNFRKTVQDTMTSAHGCQSLENVMRLVSMAIPGSASFGQCSPAVLDCMKTFAAVGDIAIGGSQNLIASGVWAAIRTTFMVVAHSDQQTEKLSRLFKTASSSLPHHQDMVKLYDQESRNLVALFHEYFIIWVKLCTKLLRIHQKSRLSRMMHLLSDSEINELELDLSLKAMRIQEEYKFLLAKDVREHAKKPNHALSNVGRQSIRTRFVAACSITYDYKGAWGRMHKLGAGAPTKSEQYEAWKRGPVTESATLVCRSSSGLEKSVFTASVVEDLNQHFADEKVPVAHYFHECHGEEAPTALGILGSLAEQLLEFVEDLSRADEWISHHAPLQAKDIGQLLRHVLPKNFRAYFAVDGISKCKPHERDSLEKELTVLQREIPLRLCMYVEEAPPNPNIWSSWGITAR